MRLLPLLLFACSIPCSLAGQAVPEGYTSHLRVLPANAGNVLHLTGPGGGALVWFDGTDLVHEDASGTRSLLTFPVPVFGSFAIAAGGAVLFGENSTGGVWLAPRNGTPPSQPLATIPFNYDAVLFGPNLAILSAKTGGFATPDNDLVALDLVTGAQQLLARLPGASGPLAVDAAGDLLYATASLAFPTPPGQTSLLRFPRLSVQAAITGHQVLGPAHAQVVATGIDSASDLACDDDRDVLFLDWFQNAIGEIDDADGPHPSRRAFATYGATSPAPVGLQFTPGSTGVFEPFQPPGSTLFVHENDFAGASQLRRVLADTATLTATPSAPVPSGPFTLQIAHGPANGMGLVAIGLPPNPGMMFLQIQVPGFEQPLLWHAAVVLPINTHFVAFDTVGAASLAMQNPGFNPTLAVLTQGAFLAATGDVIGATPPLLLHLGP